MHKVTLVNNDHPQDNLSIAGDILPQNSTFNVQIYGQFKLSHLHHRNVRIEHADKLDIYFSQTSKIYQRRYVLPQANTGCIDYNLACNIQILQENYTKLPQTRQICQGIQFTFKHHSMQITIQNLFLFIPQ